MGDKDRTSRKRDELTVEQLNFIFICRMALAEMRKKQRKDPQRY